ncbi:MAG: hypothetical protein HZB39_18390 [Planctomycetes bacterium]|nr:hypothetical protein [Planctomycetota bacterium]
MHRIAISSAVLVFVAGLSAQGLVADLELGVDRSPSSAAWEIGSSASLVWFSANGTGVGVEPFVSDGTPAGTRLLADLQAGTASSEPKNFVAFASGAAFTTRFPPLLWTSDGTRAGTRSCAVVMDDTVGPCAGATLLYFPGWDAATGRELFVSDGTPAGTRLVADLTPGVSSSSLSALRTSGDELFFVLGDALWRSDGTAAGTIEIAPSATTGTVDDLCVVNGVVFAATRRGNAGEVWRSDGTLAGTSLVRAGFTWSPNRLAALGPLLLFVADDGASGTEPWVSDGSPGGTRVLADLQAPGSGYPSVYTPFCVTGALAFFCADDGLHGAELWSTDGTPSGTRLVSDLWNGTWSSNPQAITAWGTGVAFAADHWASGRELWFSDGSAAGTRLVVDLLPNGDSQPAMLAALGTRLFFVANDRTHGFEPHVTDGSAAGTQLLADLLWTPIGSQPADFARFGQRTVFRATTAAFGSEPWLSDGSAAGTQLLADLVPGPAGSVANSFFEWRGRIWFSATRPAEGHELWTSDGTAAGTSLFLDLLPGPTGSQPSAFTPLRDRLVFAAGADVVTRELWVSDGTPGGTAMLDLDPASGSRPEGFVRYGDALLFVAGDTAHGRELWISDGSAAGTRLVTELVPGPQGSAITDLAASGGLVWFSGSDTPFVYFPVTDSVFVTDGTAAGTRRVVRFAAGTSPSDYVAFAGRTWFVTASGFERKLWSSDGTTVGTRIEYDPSPGFAFTHALVVAGGKLFFVVGDRIVSTDGSAAPFRVHALAPGASPREVLALGSSSRIVFSAADPASGRELWTSDGTATGTRMLDEIAAGPTSTNPEWLVRAGDAIWFRYDDPRVGSELFVLRLAEAEGALAERFGQGCPGSSGVSSIGAIGQPVLGDAGFAVTLDAAAPNAPAFFLIGASLFTGGDVLACSFKLIPPAIAVGWTTDASGHAVQALAIPNSPSLLGAELYAHWLQIDPAGGFLGALALSDMLEIVVGR